MTIKQKQFNQEKRLKEAYKKDDWYVKRDLVWHRFDELFKRHPGLKQVFADKAKEENDEDNPDVYDTWIFEELLNDYNDCLTEADKSSFDFCGDDTRLHFKSYCEELYDTLKGGDVDVNLLRTTSKRRNSFSTSTT